jgi:hypothetical protein
LKRRATSRDGFRHFPREEKKKKKPAFFSSWFKFSLIEKEFSFFFQIAKMISILPSADENDGQIYSRETLYISEWSWVKKKKISRNFFLSIWP